MDKEQLADDLHLIRRVLDQTHRRVDPQMFQMILWGVIVLVWYPLANWFELAGNHRGTIVFSASASPLIGSGAWRAKLGVTNSRSARNISLADNCPLRKNSVVADRADSVIAAI